MATIRPLLTTSFIHCVLKSNSSVICTKRTLLSAAYACSNAWEARRNSQILKQVDVYNFIAEIQRQAQSGHFVSAIDVDIILNCVSDAEQFGEAVRLLYKFRHSPKAADMLPSTPTAFVRSCLQYGNDETLLSVLDDPINYGVFLDSHDANILMDYYLKNGNHRDAAKVASKIMLQEDFQSKLTCWLVVLSCLKWIKEPVPEISSLTSTEGDETGTRGDDDEIYFRLPFLKNPYYDDHFDIAEFPVLVGKTLAWTSRHVDNKKLSSNLTALGYFLKKDHKQVALVLQQMLKARTPLHEEVEQRLMNESGNEKENATEEPAELPKESPAEEPDNDLEEVKAVIDQFRRSSLIIQEDLEQTVLEELTKVLPKVEAEDIKERTALLLRWNERRQERIENQVMRYLKEERLKEIDKEKQQLKEMEEYLNFFENRTKVEASVHSELLKLEEEAKKQAEAEQQHLPSDDKYVIPELSVRKQEEKLDF